MSESYKQPQTRRIQEGAAAPLFDRLIDFEPHVKIESPIGGFLSEQDLVASIFRELNLILDTRLSSTENLPNDYSGDEILLPEHFGIRDFESQSAQSNGYKVIKQAIRTAILRFEPRILDPVVAITNLQDDCSTLDVVISGDIMINKRRKPVNFPLSLRKILHR